MSKFINRTELYLIRHAESTMNVQPHLVGGRSNHAELSPKGIEQAKTLGRYLLAEGVEPTRIYASPALRTLQTAQYSLVEMGLTHEPVVHDALQELSQGVCEGRLRSEVYTPKVLADITRLGKDFRLEGGESMNDVGLRMLGWATETLAAEPARAEGEQILVYTHGGAIRYFASHILDWSHQKTYETEIANASVSLLTYGDGQWDVEYLSKVPVV